MATTVAQHSVATFTSPVNGTTPIDANTVRGNDNTVRSSYNDHDADPGIHVQSSTLASRPVAGTAGRKWITDDGGVYTLWFDDGTHWHPVSSENVALTVLAGENLVKGDVVKVTGWNNGQDLPEVVKTTSAADTAFAVITATVTSGSLGYATNTGIVQDVNTAAYSVGTILYANGSGGFTSTKPTSGNYQPVAYVLRANASNGVYYVEFSTPRIVERSDNTASTVVLRDSNGDFSAGTITATAVNATTLDLTNLEVTNIKAKDGTQAIAIADTTGKLTISDGVLLSALTASQAVFTDGSKNLVSNAITGTGNVVMSASPTLTGTVTAATLNATTLGGTLSTAAQPNVTSVGTLSSLTVSGATTASGGATISGGSFAQGRIYSTSAEGFAIGARTGSVYDFILYNPAGSFTGGIINVPTGTGTVNIPNGNLAVDTNTLFVDAANNRVGVGTATPSAALHVVGVARSDVGFVAALGATLSGFVGPTATWLGTGTDSNLAISAYGATGAVTFYTAGGSTERMRLDTSGNLGLGVTPSAWNASSAIQFVGGNAVGRYGVTQNAYLDSLGQMRYIATAAAARYEHSSGTHIWSTAPSGTAGNAITFVQAMTLDASGNLGVGAASPTFGAGSGVEIERAGIATLRLQNTSNANAFEIQTDSATNGVLLRGYNASPLVFYTNNSEAARITSGGDVGIGTANPAFALGSGLEVERAGIATLRLENSSGGNGIEIAADSTTNGIRFYGLNNAPFVFAPNASERMRIDNTSTAGQTALLLYDVDNNTVERVTVGAADSGGTGFKVLRIPN